MKHSLNGIVLLAAYLAAALLTGAALSPWLFAAGKWFAQSVTAFHHDSTPGIGWFAEKLRHSEFDRYFNRSMLISAIFWLWPFSKWAGVTKSDLKLEKNKFKWQDGMIGFMLASGLLLVMGFMFVYNGRFAIDLRGNMAAVVAAAMFAAICVALLEEWFFRGALMGLLLRSMKPIAALLFLSLFFAVIHLLQPPEDVRVTDSAVQAGTGFWMVGQILGKFGNAQFLIAEGATLFMVGLILGWARLKTRSLALSIGLHAGWVFGVKFFADITRTPRKVPIKDYLPWIGENLKIGATPLIILTVTGVLVIAWLIIREMALKTMKDKV